jgi:chromosome partitioning protein
VPEAKTVSFINMKGGVGKTTLAVNIAYALAYFEKKKVLLVDLDPQFNATQYLISDKKYLSHFNSGKPFALDIYRKRASSGLSLVNSGSQQRAVLEPTLENLRIPIHEGNGGKLDLIASALEMIELDMSTRGTERKLKTFVHTIRGAYDYVILDCPPTIGFLTISAYLASDGITIPVRPDYLSSIGLPLLEKYLGGFEEDRDGEAEQIGIIFSMVDRRSNIMEQIRPQLENNRYIFENSLGQSVQAARAVSDRLPLFLYRKTKETRGEEIKAIAKEFLHRAEEIW